jgi:hypothetical protein
MRHFLGRRARRIPALLFCLALFLGGSNYCLLSAWAGNTRMACMATPGATTAAPRCHHCAPAGKASRSGQPAGRSCCPDPVLMPGAPSLDKAVASHAAPFTVMLAADLAPSAAPFLSEHSPPLLPAGQPPTGPACAPQAPRAPPLA